MSTRADHARMTMVVGIMFVIGVLGYGLAQALRYRRHQADVLSESWRAAQERKDWIAGGQWTGIVKWPWPVDDDAA